MPLNSYAVDPQLADVLTYLKKQVMLELNCCHIATIQSFDGETKTCTATINYQKTFMVRDANGLYSPKPMAYPTLIDVPCFIPTGGPAFLSMPIQKGDQAFIIFNDRDMDNWFAGQINGEVATPRLHSMSDGIAIVGLRNLSNTDDSYDANHALLKWGDTQVGVSETQALIKNSATTLGTALGQLVDAISGIIIDVSGPTGTVSPASVTALNAVKTTLQGLLE